MLKINEKFNKEEIKILEQRIRFMAFMGAYGAPTTQEEFDAWCDETIKKHYEEEAKAERAKQRKIQREVEKATAMGMTVEEYKEYIRAKRNYEQHARDIEKLEEQLAEHRKKAEWWKNKMDKYNKAVK